MTGWTFDIGFTEFLGDCLLLAVLFGAALAIRRKSTLLKAYLIPASLIAGFAGFLAGPAVLDWISFDSDRMGQYVYHLLALTFIVVGLRRRRSRASAAAFHVGFVKTITVILQGLIGLGILFAFHAIVDRSLSPAIGMLLPLGFGMGPGIALSVGLSWEGYGVAGASDAGLAIAATGFLIAYGVGVWSVNRGVRRGVVSILSIHGDNHANDRRGANDGRTARSAGLEGRLGRAALASVVALAVSTVIIYAVTYGLMLLASAGMDRVGMAAEVPVLWSLNFLWANLVAMSARSFAATAAPGLSHILDHGIADRVVGVLADLLVATAVMAIGLTLAPSYFLPLALACVAGAAVTYYVVARTVAWAFQDHVFMRFAGLFGEQTGTVSSGLALIRIMDPGYTTPVAQDQVLGSGTALVLGFPLLLLINLPLTRFGGSGTGYAVVAVLLAVYLLLAVVGWRAFRRRRQSLPSTDI